jgi:hypothetical protein
MIYKQRGEINNVCISEVPGVLNCIGDVQGVGGLYHLRFAVRCGSCSGPQAVSEKKSFQKLYQTLNEWKLHPHLPVLKLPLLADLEQKVGELVISINSCQDPG